MPTIMKEQMEVSIRVTPQQAFDFIKQQVDANEGFDEDTDQCWCMIQPI